MDTVSSFFLFSISCVKTTAPKCTEEYVKASVIKIYKDEVSKKISEKFDHKIKFYEVS